MEPYKVSFTELGMDIDIGTKLFKMFKISAGDLAHSDNVTRLKRIASYLNTHSNPDKVMRQVAMGNRTQLTNLEYLDSLVCLENQKKEALQTLIQTDEELQQYAGASNQW